MFASASFSPLVMTKQGQQDKLGMTLECKKWDVKDLE